MKQPFSIIANNCWGAEVYKHFNLPFNTPVIGLFFYPECYLKFVSNIDKNLSTELSFTEKSKYLDKKVLYPIGIVNGIEIHFLHYENEEDAFDKWTRRCKRVSDGKQFFKFDDRDGATTEHINQFLNMNLPNSVCFTKDVINHPNHVQVPMPKKESSVMDGLSLFKESIKYFDLEEWLNGNGVVKRFAHKLQQIKRKLICAIK